MSLVVNKRRRRPEMNLVPLIDVLVMLIFFAFVTMQFRSVANLNLTLPKVETAGKSEAKDAITISIDKDGNMAFNGKPARLAASARIFGPDNLIKVPASVARQKLVVNYTLDGFGQVNDVWILSAAEAAKQPWPKTSAEAQAWVFDPTLQRWSKP